MTMDYQAWRCKNNISQFCPPEGCSANYGCAIEKGWDDSQPSPFADPITGVWRPMGNGVSHLSDADQANPEGQADPIPCSTQCDWPTCMSNNGTICLFNLPDSYYDDMELSKLNHPSTPRPFLHRLIAESGCPDDSAWGDLDAAHSSD